MEGTSYFNLEWPSIFPLGATLTGNSVPRWISEFYVHITMKISLNMTHNMFKYVEIQVSNQRSKVRKKSLVQKMCLLISAAMQDVTSHL